MRIIHPIPFNIPGACPSNSATPLNSMLSCLPFLHKKVQNPFHLRFALLSVHGITRQSPPPVALFRFSWKHHSIRHAPDTYKNKASQASQVCHISSKPDPYSPNITSISVRDKLSVSGKCFHTNIVDIVTQNAYIK